MEILSEDERDGSLVSNIFFITFFIYDGYDSYSRANTHGDKVLLGLINVISIG